MTTHTPADEYARPARILHWLMAALFIFMWAGGYIMSEFVEEDTLLEKALYQLHMSTGVALFALLIARIFVRRRNAPPPPLASLSAWEARASHFAHIALYVLPALVVIAGWVQVDMGGHHVPFYWLFTFPSLLPDIEVIGGFELEEPLEDVHKYLAYTMLAVAVVHAAAVGKHRWADGHDVLGRMAPKFRRGA